MTSLGLNDEQTATDWPRKQRNGKIIALLFLLLFGVYAFTRKAPLSDADVDRHSAKINQTLAGFEPGDSYCAVDSRPWPQSFTAYMDLLEAVRAHASLPYDRDSIRVWSGWKIRILRTDWDLLYTKAKIEWAAKSPNMPMRDSDAEAVNKVIYTSPLASLWKKCE